MVTPKKYLQYVSKLHSNQFQMFYLEVTNQSFSTVTNWLKDNYKYLSNYCMCVITFNAPINWLKIAKIAIYMENFLTEKKFKIFLKKKSNRIKILEQFLLTHKHILYNEDMKSLIHQFYQGVSYGFQFKDMFIGKQLKRITLVMQKVKYSSKRIRCPICFSKDVHSNSCQQFMMQSFECNNSKCPQRSPHGRGKRFSLLSAECQMELQLNNFNNHISDHLWNVFRRDIVADKDLNLYNLIQLYSFSSQYILTNMFYGSINGRIIKRSRFTKNKNIHFNSLPIIRLFKNIFNNIIYPKNSRGLTSKIGKSIIMNDNSENMNNYSFKAYSAITSPPYYNARKYSQWNNFICYLIDMLIDMKSVYNKLKYSSVYIYNVGDVEERRKDYVTSNMSTMHLMLGFWSICLAHLVGFNINGDIIWDKGQVQSYRHFSHHFSMYSKPINCYEHCIVLSKGKRNIPSKIVCITPVRKINSQGRNTYGHSAPFPIQVAKLILPYSNQDDYILDPYLGSGTTCRIAQQYGYKSIGFELNEKYYLLSKERI